MAETKNSVDGASLNVTADINLVLNYGNKVTINGDSRGNLLINGEYSILAGDEVLINGAAGNDTISSYGQSSILKGAAGADLIFNGYSYWNVTDKETVKVEDFFPYVTSDLGARFLRGNNSTITGGEGNDTIKNIGDKVSIDGGAGDDSIHNGGHSATISGGAGNGDNIIINGAYYKVLGGDNVSVYAGAGNDTVSGYGENSTLDGGAGNDVILNGYAYTEIINTLTAETLISFSDSLEESMSAYYLRGCKSKVTGNDGDDFIKNIGDEVSIDGGNGSDFLINGEYYCIIGNKVTLNGGEGNDILSNGGTSALIDGGNDDDLIFNGYTYYNSTFYGSIDSSYKSYFKDGDYSTVKAGAGNDTIYNRGSNTSINGGAGVDGIYNFGDSVAIAGEDGDDFIQNFADKVSIDGGNNDDILINGEYPGSLAGDSVSIAGGKGNDLISNIGLKATLEGGEGNDSIFNGYSYYETVNSETDEIGGYFYIATLEGYTGDKTSVLSGDGDDFIQNNGASSTIDAGKGADTIINSGNDVSIFGGADNDNISVSGSKIAADGGAGADYIYSSSAIEGLFEGGADNDTVNVNAFYSTIGGGAGNDYVSVSGSNVSVYGGAGDDTFRAELKDSTLEGDKGNDVIDFRNSTGNNKYLYNTGDGSDTIYNFSSTDTIEISGVAYNSVVSDDALILNVGNDSITVYDAAYDAAWLSSINIVGTLQEEKNSKLVRSDTKSPVTVDSETDNIISFGRIKAVQITGNDKDNSILGGKGADTLNGAGGNDTLTGGKGNDIFVYSAGNDVITDYANGDKISLASDAAISDVAIEDNDVVLTTNKGTLKIIDGYKVRKNNGTLTTTDNKITFIEGKKSPTYIFSEHKIFDRNKTAITLTAGAKDSTLKDLNSKLFARMTIIDATTSALKNITGNGKANKIYASSGGATLNGAKGNDTLTGGDGADVFVYAKNMGKDVIQNCGANDVISLGGGATLSDISTKKNDVIFKAGGKKLTVKDAKDTTITFNDNGAIKTFTAGVLYNSGKTAATLATSFSATGTTAIGSATIDASFTKKGVNISGGNSANSILGGKRNDTLYGAGGNDTLTGGKGKDLLYGNKGNDMLIGGAGNDSLWGGDGSDNFLYSKGDGKDVIFGFANDDTLTLDKVTLKSSTVSKKGDVLTLKVKSGSITFKEFTATTFHINRDSYTISNGTLKKN